MFSGCKGLTSLDLSSFDTGNVTDMLSMFYGCEGLTSLDLSSFDTRNVTRMSNMFSGCKGLTSLDLSKFDTGNVTDMFSMFSDCEGLTSLDLSSFDTGNVTDMTSMFAGCSGLTSLDVSSFDTSNVTNMKDMFSFCEGLTTIYATDKFVTTSVTSGGYCFYNCSKLRGGAGTTYDSSRMSADYARIDGGTDAPGYFTLKPIGSKSKPDAVGDIVFTDGSATPYSADLTLTDAQKAAAIALIFYKGTGLNSGDDTTTSRTLGVGLKHNRSELEWCLESADAYDTNITTIQCPASGDAGALTFTGDRNGSDNLEQIEAFDGVDDTATEANYPAFYFGKNYKDTATNIAGTDYESGWYLPSFAELFQIYANGKGENKVFDIDAASEALGGDKFGNSCYWSSSQYASYDDMSYQLYFYEPVCDDYHYKYHSMATCVCAVRAFN
ncbi:MAG: BspA family leucine-rich repeat surface protein, partial [Treponema sp.]|nr:BspA family leucine-rich repeat surface protein [Treponema sp.]